MAYIARIGNVSIVSHLLQCSESFNFNFKYFLFVEGSPRGLISWKFDLSLTNLAILLVSVSCPGTTFEDGEIEWKICSEDQCQILPNGR